MRLPDRSWWAAWRPALRIALRDALRARGRSALILVMIALPVVALTAADVLARSAQLDPDEEATRMLGRAQALVGSSYEAGALLQHPNPFRGTVPASPEGEAGEAGPVDPRHVLEVLGADYRVLTSQDASVEVRVRAGEAIVGWSEVEVGDAAFAGRYLRRAGRAPETADEVAVTSDLRERLGVRIGESVPLANPAGRTFTLTGVFDRVGQPEAEEIWAVPGALIGDPLAAQGPPQLFLVGDRAVTWADVRALNAEGVTAYSRAVIVDPPPRKNVPYFDRAGDSSGSMVFDIVALTVLVVLAGLEVSLLAGAAFAVGTRRQARALALVTAAGGTRRDVRRVLLAGGLVLGVAAGVAGVALGVAAAAVGRPALIRAFGADFGRFDVRPLELLAIAGLAVLMGVASAVLPARHAARQDPVAVLAGRRGQVRSPRKVPVIGVAVTAVGVAAAALGSSLALAMATGVNPAGGGMTSVVALLIAGGAALTQLGLIVCSPALVGLAGRWSHRLPLAARLALRDAARHRGRSAPALAAILTAVTGSTALLLYVAAIDARDRDAYDPRLPAGHGGVSLTEVAWDPVTQEERVRHSDPADIEPVLRTTLPGFRSTVVHAATDMCWDECHSGYAQIVPAERNASYPFAEAYSGLPVIEGDTLDDITGGVTSREAEQVLADGGVVVFQPGLLRPDGTVRFEVVTPEQARAADETGQPVQPKLATLPGVHLPMPTDPGPGGVYSPGAADRLGLNVRPTLLLLDFDRPPTRDEEQAANAALNAAGLTGSLLVERGYESDYALGLLILVAAAAVITLGATGIATGLAQADARADHATLAAVGAAPGVRRRLAGAQALSLAALGALLGIGAGFVPALALIGAVRSLEVTIPWLQLGLVLVGIPFLAGALAFAFTRSRMPLERRVA